MNLYEILGILFIHWFADFVCQTHEQSMNKSKRWGPLLEHTFSYSFIWFISLGLYSVFSGWSEAVTINMVFLFPLITFLCHTVTDYITSRENSILWEKGKIHDFFVCIGFDQYLHYIQLFLTYWFLTR